MSFECLSINGFAGDRTSEAMQECHWFAYAISKKFEISLTLSGQAQMAANLQWDDALSESKTTFLSAQKQLKKVLDRNKKPILITPRCATAIATLPIIIEKYPDVVVVYFDAHGDLNTPETSKSGYLGGMPITAALGEWDSGYGAGLKSQNLIHIGGRDMDDSEIAFIEKNNILTISKNQIENGLDDLSSVVKGRKVFVHLDTDVFDPSEVTAEYAVEDGLFRDHVAKVIRTLISTGALVGVEITELSPKNEKQREQSFSAICDSFCDLFKSG